MKKPVSRGKTLQEVVEAAAAQIDHDSTDLAPPNTVRVSAAALEIARKLMQSIPAEERASCVAAFTWSRGRASGPPGGPYDIYGPGLDVVALGRDQIPPAAIEEGGGIEFVVEIPKERYEQSGQREIDVDDAEPFGLVLR